ncbi:MAG: GNAT family N-acetyltransferase [Candidatus Kapaibacterium sp.]
MELDAFHPPERVPKSIGSLRLLLRQYRTSDAESLAELLAISYKDHLAPWSPPGMEREADPSGGRRAAREHILVALDKWEDGSDYRFFITLRATGEIVGQMGLTQIIRGVSQSCFIGYWVGLPYVHRGYATEALVLAMEFAFDVLNLHRVSLWIATGNEVSLKIPARLGLRFEGTAMRGLFLGSKWHDTHIYAMTSEEWKARKEELKRLFTP